MTGVQTCALPIFCRSFVGQRPVTKKNLSSPKTNGICLPWLREILRERERYNELHAGRKQKPLFGLVPIRHLKAQYIHISSTCLCVWLHKYGSDAMKKLVSASDCDDSFGSFLLHREEIMQSLFFTENFAPKRRRYRVESLRTFSCLGATNK